MTYTAIYKRDPDDDAWLVHIKDVEGCYTFGRTLPQARERIRDCLGLFDDHHETVEIVDEVLFDLPAKKAMQRATRAKAKAEAAQEEASAAMRAAVAVMREAGLKVRDVGHLLGVSHQRVSKLSGSEPTTTPPQRQSGSTK
jgi:predicted RNase H-like HicB family nuclease